MPTQKIISIVVPVFNEEQNIVLFCDAFFQIWEKLKEKYSYELIFVDDGSTDSSPEVLERFAKQYEGLYFLQFSRNFGKETALSAGIDAANGDAVIMIDVDLQHPLSLFLQFVEKWEQGAEVVVGVREKNTGEGIIKKYGSILFYTIMDAIGETRITPRATDYRLIDKKVALEFRRFTEHSRMTRGLIDWLGFKREYIPFVAEARRGIAPARYSKIKLLKLALSTFISHSLFPLKLAGYLGLFITTVFGCAGIILLLGRYVFKNPFALSFTGSAQLAILILFLVGVILSCLGLVALYIGTINDEVSNRPRYVIRKDSRQSLR